MGSGEPSLAQPDPATLARWREVAEAFALPGRWLSSRPYGSGWINETLLVEREHEGRRTRWIQQRINARVFREPALVMENVARVTAHQRAVLLREGARDAEPDARRGAGDDCVFPFKHLRSLVKWWRGRFPAAVPGRMLHEGGDCDVALQQ